MSSILITGGAGFIGVNSARYFHSKGWRVVLLDNLSRLGATENLDWLRSRTQMQFERTDIRDSAAVKRVVGEVSPDLILHLAAQVAVTSSVSDPRHDFEVNALGTLNLLEAIRLECPRSFFINASTNKVYGKMEDLKVVEQSGRYEYRDVACGIGEDRPLDFHSPYGCSKGTADQYSLDYARIYGLSTVSFRQSCIYGTRQFGVEDQGWVAWFTIASILGKPITIYGDGKQIRDVLHVDDLVRAYEAAWNSRAAVAGQAFNIGGGPANTLSLLELVSCLEEDLGNKIPLHWSEWRPGDQPVFVSNLEKAASLLKWSPNIDARTGLKELIAWVKSNKTLLERFI